MDDYDIIDNLAQQMSSKQNEINKINREKNEKNDKLNFLRKEFNHLKENKALKSLVEVLYHFFH